MVTSQTHFFFFRISSPLLIDLIQWLFQTFSANTRPPPWKPTLVPVGAETMHLVSMPQVGPDRRGVGLVSSYHGDDRAQLIIAEPEFQRQIIEAVVDGFYPVV